MGWFSDAWDSITGAVSDVVDFISPALTVWNPVLGPLVETGADLLAGHSARQDVQQLIGALGSGAIAAGVGGILPTVSASGVLNYVGLPTVDELTASVLGSPLELPTEIPGAVHQILDQAGVPLSSFLPEASASSPPASSSRTTPWSTAMFESGGNLEEYARKLQENHMGYLEDAIASVPGLGWTSDILNNQALNDISMSALDVLGIGAPMADLGIIPPGGSTYGPTTTSAVPADTAFQVYGPPAPAGYLNGGTVRSRRLIPYGGGMVPSGYRVKNLPARKATSGHAEGAFLVPYRRMNPLNPRALNRALSRAHHATALVRKLYSLPKHVLKKKKHK